MLFIIILLIIVILILGFVILPFILLNYKKIIEKIKLFCKKFKWLIFVELIVIIALTLFNVFGNTIILKEKDPHSNVTLKSQRLKEGDSYTYSTMYYEINEDEINFNNASQFFKEKDNTVKIINVGIDKIKVLVDGVEKDFRYGKGFSYLGPNSCMCGTPIIFEKSLTGAIILLIIGILIINLFILIFVKNKDLK